MQAFRAYFHLHVPILADCECSEEGKGLGMSHMPYNTLHSWYFQVKVEKSKNGILRQIDPL